MYIRTPRAYCWRDDPLPVQPALEPARQERVATTVAPTRWALQPWPSKAGPLVAVRLVLGAAQVGVRIGSRLQWVAADSVLTPRQAQRWASNGF